MVLNRPTKIALLCCVLLWACVPQLAAAETAAEVKVKAAVVHKIAKFVTWPDSAFQAPDSPIRFCVSGNGGIHNALDRMGGRPIHGRAVVVKRVDQPAEAAASCDLLYLTEDADREPGDWLRAVANKPVLTFGDAGAYGGDDSIVMLTIRRNKVRFAINLEANANTGLSISAQLLQLAAGVGGGA